MPTLVLTISAVLAIFIGALILIWPKLIRIAIGLYLILFGILQLFLDKFA